MQSVDFEATLDDRLDAAVDTAIRLSDSDSEPLLSGAPMAPAAASPSKTLAAAAARSVRERRRTASTSSTDSSSSSCSNNDERPSKPQKQQKLQRQTAAVGDEDEDDDYEDEDAEHVDGDAALDPFRNHGADIKHNSALQQFYPPFLMMPFQERRRLSQCKEEEDEDDLDAGRLSATSPSRRAISSSSGSAPVGGPVISPQHVTGTRHKFIVTKTNADSPHAISPNNAAAGAVPVAVPVAQVKTAAVPRAEALHLRHMTARQNAATISFPCRSSVYASSALSSSSSAGAAGSKQRTSVMHAAFFSPQKEFTPHMDKRFFDTSLVEIRTSIPGNSVAGNTATHATAATSAVSAVDRSSTQSLNVSASDEPDGNVWVPRADEPLERGSDTSILALSVSRMK